MPISERGPGWTYRPDTAPPSIFGTHQPGVATPRLEHLALAAYDVPAADLREALTAWSAAAEAAMRAEPGALTVTIGLGLGAFEGERAAARPRALRELPPFPGDALDPALCGGDVCVQVCARDAAAAAAALPVGTKPRLLQHGRLHDFHPERSPRDPLGFRDGTNNLRRPRDHDRHVWIASGDRTWMLGGTMLVYRRIEVDLERWRALDLAEQERVVGRHRDSGAPLGMRREFDAMRAERFPAGAHAREAAPSVNRVPPMLRRSYAFDGGLLFLAFMRDPRRQFVPVQRRLAEHDALTPFLRHTGSAVFAIPPGASPGGFVGDGLF